MVREVSIRGSPFVPLSRRRNDFVIQRVNRRRRRTCGRRQCEARGAGGCSVEGRVTESHPYVDHTGPTARDERSVLARDGTRAHPVRPRQTRGIGVIAAVRRQQRASDEGSGLTYGSGNARPSLASGQRPVNTRPERVTRKASARRCDGVSRASSAPNSSAFRTRA